MRHVWIGLALAMLPAMCAAKPLGFAQERAIDAAVTEWLGETNAPSASIAVVVDGDLAYVQAYGTARMAPHRPATPETRYAIASVSKEFTAAALLLLQEENRLSLDDRVAKYFPDLAGADKVSLRELLNHTAGYRDYWPQDFVPPAMLRPITTRALLETWGTRPLDFEPGTDWQYSNTGHVIAGAIAEKVAGQPLFDFLRLHVFAPLRMSRVFDVDRAPLPLTDAGGYTRYAGGPVRPAPKEGAGWLFAAGELAMEPRDLARWDISLMNRSLLTAASYEALTTTTRLKNGKDAHYGLGLDVAEDQGRRRIGHGGEASGFLAVNRIWPDERVAIVAFTNNDWASPDTVANRIAFVVLKPTAAEARARAVFEGFRVGTVDRGLFTADGNAYLTSAVLADQAEGLRGFGVAREFVLEQDSMRGGMRTRIWRIVTSHRALRAVERGYPDGKLEQFMLQPLP